MYSCYIIGETSLTIQCAERLLQHGFTIKAIITEVLEIKSWALQNQIEIISSLDRLIAYPTVDYLFSIVNGKILSSEILKKAKNYAINYHDSLLPSYAGVNATTWAIINNEEIHGVTWHIMQEEIDTGDILGQEKITILPSDTALLLNLNCYAAAIKSFEHLLLKLLSQQFNSIKQNINERTYYKITHSLHKYGFIDWQEDAKTVERLQRALTFGDYYNPVGLLKVYINSNFYTVKSLEICSLQGYQGEVLVIDSSGITIGLKTDAIRITELSHLDGTLVAPIEIPKLKAGDYLLLPPDQLLSQIASAQKLLAKEHYWITQLRDSSILNLFNYTSSNKYLFNHQLENTSQTLKDKNYTLFSSEKFPSWLKEKPMIDAVLSLLLIYFYQLNRQQPYSVGITTKLLMNEYHELSELVELAPLINVSIAENLTLKEGLEQIYAQIERHKKQKTYFKDIFQRHPLLTNKCFFQSDINLLKENFNYQISFNSQVNLQLQQADDKVKLILYADSSVLENEDGLKNLLVNANNFILKCKAPNQAIAHVPLVAETEYRQLRFNWNQTEMPYPTDKVDKMIHQLFEEQVENTPNNIALIFKDQPVTYRELNERANQIAFWLKKQDVKPDELIAISLERSIEFIAIVLAIFKAGGAYVPVDPSYPTERLQFMLENAQAKVLFTHSQLISKFYKYKGQCVATDTLNLHDFSNQNLASEGDSKNLAYVIYTSGSTGQPKGVMIEHQSLFARLFDLQRLYNIVPTDKILFSSSPSFDASIEEFILPLLFGACTIIAPTDVEQESFFVRMLMSGNITGFNTVPVLLRLILEQIQTQQLADKLKLHYVTVGGDILSTEICQMFFKSFQAKLYNMYGPTENTIDSTYFNCSLNNYTLQMPIGKPMANSQAYVLNENLQFLPIGIAGELYVGGVGVARGYLRCPELTQQKFIANPFSKDEGNVSSRYLKLYRTGDLVRYLHNGNLEFLGRTDQQIKINGFRIESGEIENILIQQPGVKDAVVIAEEVIPNNKRLVAYLVQEKNDIPNEKEVEERLQWLQEALRRKLPHYMIPKIFMFIERLPLNVNGKLSRDALPKPNNKKYRQVLPQKPVTHAEKVLVTTIAKLLRLPMESVCVNDNFLQIGGDSILAIQLVSRLREQKWQLSVRDIFAKKILKVLAHNMHQKPLQKIISQDLITGQSELLPIQHWFFEQKFVYAHHFNQGLLFEVYGQLDLLRLKEALHKIIVHHDQLRAHYQEYGLQFIDKTYSDDVLLQIEIESEMQVTEQCNKIQGSFCLNKGGLFKTALIKTNQKQWLGFFAHHLVVDMVSWKLILEDLMLAYEGRPLAEKTLSYKTWTQEVLRYSISERERQYWNEQCSVIDLPTDHNLGQWDGWHSVTFSFTGEETLKFLHNVPIAYHTQVNDVLLTALVRAFGVYFKRNALQVGLESHGRTASAAFFESDVSRTIGWFTSIYNIHLKLGETNTLGRQLLLIKEQLRQVPANGIGYGVLRYILKDKQVSVDPKVVFNYFGQMDNTLETIGFLKPAVESIGMLSHPSNKLSSSFEINCGIEKGRLTFAWLCAAHLYKKSTLNRLIENYQSELRSLIAHCSELVESNYSPSDFEAIKHTISQEVLESIVKTIRQHSSDSALQIEDIYPVSPLQAGLVYQGLLPSHNNNYFVQHVYELQGQLESKYLKQAWEIIIKQYPILRTGFIVKNDRLLQYVLSKVRLPWQSIDWNFEERQPLSRLRVYLANERKQQCFDLTRAPLLNINLIKYEDKKHYLIFSYHHSILDGWSEALLFEQLWTVYHQLILNETVCLPYSPNYRDYIAWVEQQNCHNALAYWQQQLTNIEPCAIAAVLPLNTANEMKDHDIVLSADLSSKLVILAQEQEVTLNVVCLSAILLVLSRYLQREDMVIGITISGRDTDLDGHDKIIGLSINTLPLFIKLKQEVSLHEIYQQVQQELHTLNNYSYMQLAEILRLSGAGRNLFDVLFVFENFSIRKNDLNKLNFSHVYGIERTEYPLTVTCIPEKQLRIRISHQISQEEQWIIDQLGQHIEYVLEQMVLKSMERIEKITLLTDKELKTLLVDRNQTQVNFLQTQLVHQLFEEQVKRTPNNIALTFENQSLTYYELDIRANKLALYLRNMGVTCGTLVIVSLERNFNLIVSILAILKAGGGYVPLDPDYPLERLQFILENTQSKIVLTSSMLANQFSNYSVKCLKLDTLVLDKFSIQSLDSTNRLNDLAYVIYTSGSTGYPKGVAIEHHSVCNLLLDMLDRFKLQKSDHCLFSTNISFDIAGLEIFLPLMIGANLIIVDELNKLENERLLTLLNEQFITFMQATPTVWRIITDIEGLQFNKSLTALCGGEILDVHLANKLLEKVGRLWNLYGPTETTIWSTAVEVTKGNIRNITIGKPIANTKVYIFSNASQLMPIGIMGELYLSGIGVARGYYARPDLDQKSFFNNPYVQNERMYKTGDIACYMPNGEIRIIGRADHQIKIRGHRVELAEIETVLKAHITIKDAVVIKYGINLNSEKLIAFIIRKDDSFSLNNLLDVLKKKLPSYMIPSEIKLIDKFPLTSSGKINRKFLIENIKEDKRKVIFPRNSTESTLLQIWQELLIHEDISITDEFHMVGGHSLLWPRLLFRIQKIFEINLSLKDIIHFQRIIDLAALINNNATKHQQSIIMKIQPEGEKIPLFLVHPIGGLSFLFNFLASYIKDRPIYGINNPYFGTEKISFPSIEEMADFYSKEIRKIQSKGPYLLGGRSFGGFVAYEMARQLKAAGEQVELVILMDSYIAESNISLYDHFVAKMTQRKIDMNSTLAKYLYDQYEKNTDLIKKYTPSFYDGRVALLSCCMNIESFKKTLKCWNVCRNTLEVHSIPGGHGEMLDAEFIEDVSKKILLALDKNINRNVPREFQYGFLTTQLLLAARFSDYTLVEFLIILGANPLIEKEAGLTVYMWIMRYGSEKLQQIMNAWFLNQSNQLDSLCIEKKASNTTSMLIAYGYRLLQENSLDNHGSIKTRKMTLY